MNEKTDRKEYLKKYAEEHKEERRKRAREYYYNNREKRKEYDKQRRLKIKNNPELNQKMKDYKREWTRENRKKQKEKINNLQSKIDKAIEYVNKQCTQLEGYGDYEINSEVKQELLSILKEDK